MTLIVEAPTLGRRLKLLRMARGLRQRELAAQAEVGLTTLQRLELDERTPHRSTLRALANALGVDVAVLVAGEAPAPAG